jgi:hypothetical protein
VSTNLGKRSAGGWVVVVYQQEMGGEAKTERSPLAIFLVGHCLGWLAKEHVEMLLLRTHVFQRSQHQDHQQELMCH